MKDGSKRMVVDSSVTVAWFFADEARPETDSVLRLLESGWEAIAPPIWPLEIANVFVVAERRQRQPWSELKAALRRLEKLPVTVEAIEVPRTFGEVISLARREELTAYDACYLELALRHSIPLATIDSKLRRSAAGMRIPLLPS
jgi:predicted nucleic acid-binding protein